MTINEIHNAPGYAGVYCFKNKINEKRYIGQAIKLKQNFKEHWRNCSNPKYSNVALYKDILKYGWDNFELIILKEFRDALSWRTKGNLDYWEKYYIEKYAPEYNSIQNPIKLEQLENADNYIKAKNIETKEIFIFKTIEEAEENLHIPKYVINKCILKVYKIGYKKWQFAYYNEEIPEYDDFEEILYNQFKELSNKEKIIEYIKENPKCSYGEIKQTFELSKKDFYNYCKELGITFNKKIK